MNERKNVVIGKIGKTVRFKGIKIAQGGGADVTWYSLISRMNPTYHFYFVGPNDLNKLTQEEYDYIFPNRNVHSVYGEDKTKTMKDIYKPLWDNIEKEGVKFDFGIVFVGSHSDKSIYNFLKKESGVYYRMLNAFSHYVGPYTYVFNRTGIPWYTLTEDARYVTFQVKDLLNSERASFSQMNGVLRSHPRIIDAQHDVIYNKSKTTQWKYDNIPVIYAGLEKIFLNSISRNWKDNIDIDRKLKSPTNKHILVLSNGCGVGQLDGGSGNNSWRLPLFKEWLIDNLKGTEYEDTKIYGLWEDYVYEQEPSIQNKLLVDSKEEIADAKYTFVSSQLAGFVTIKPWEMVTLGLLPFFHPDYDKDHLLPFPEYLTCKDEKDFLNKVRELDANPEKYKALLNECFALIKDEDLDGSRINNFVFSYIANDVGFEYEKPQQGVEQIFNRFNKNFITK